MQSVVKRFSLVVAGLLCVVPVAGWGQTTPTGPPEPARDSAREARPLILASVQQIIARAPFNPLNRRNPPARPVAVLPAQNKARLLRKIRATMKARGYLIEAYRPDSLSCRVSKATDARSKDRYLLWLEPPATPAAESAAVQVFVQYGNFMHFWGTPAGQESAAMTMGGEYEKKINQLKSLLDTLPR